MDAVYTKITNAPELENSVENAAAKDVVQKRVRTKWTSYVWDTLDKSPEERKFLFKLDAALLTFASLGITFIYHDIVLYHD
jgi:ACS family pantothenate transporter-like MFS transporter